MGWVVRVSTSYDEPFSPRLPPIWVEQMRYASMVSLVRSDEKEQVLDLNPPVGMAPGAKVWAEQTAASMKSFGYKAEAMKK